MLLVLRAGDKRRPEPDQRLAREKYRRLAPGYDRLARRSRMMRRLAVERLDLKRGDVVLDIGCGTGLTFPMVEERVGPEGRLIGVDLSPDMLAVARERAEQSGWRNVTLIEASVEEAHIPVQAGAVVSVLTHDVLRSPKALENVIAHLKPGGRIAVTGAKWAPRWALPVKRLRSVRGAAVRNDLRGLRPALGPPRTTRARPARTADPLRRRIRGVGHQAHKWRFLTDWIAIAEQPMMPGAPAQTATS